METYLVHHGILGQRWGIRRYQNKDGSLTPKGKKRLEKIEKKLKGVNEKIDADYEKYKNGKLKTTYASKILNRQAQFDYYQKKGEKIAGKLLKTQKKVPFTVDEQLDVAKRLGMSDKDIDKLRKTANRLQTNNHLQNRLRDIQMQRHMQMSVHNQQLQQLQQEQIQRQINLEFQQQANLAMQQHMQSVMQQQIINHQFMYM